jgi:hypothetical protein
MLHYDAAMAAHYVVHLEPDPDEAMRWHVLALEHAQLDSRAAELMGSLLVGLGGGSAQDSGVSARRATPWPWAFPLGVLAAFGLLYTRSAAAALSRR